MLPRPPPPHTHPGPPSQRRPRARGRQPVPLAPCLPPRGTFGLSLPNLAPSHRSLAPAQSRGPLWPTSSRILINSPSSPVPPRPRLSGHPPVLPGRCREVEHQLCLRGGPRALVFPPVKCGPHLTVASILFTASYSCFVLSLRPHPSTPISFLSSSQGLIPRGGGGGEGRRDRVQP